MKFFGNSVFYKKNRVTISWLIAFFITLSTVISGFAVMHSDSTIGNPIERRLFANIIWGCITLSLFVSFLFKKIRLSPIIFFPLVYFLLVGIDSYTTSHFPFLILYELGVFCIMDNEVKLIVYKQYRTVLIIMAAIGIIIYANTLLDGFIPYRLIPYYSPGGIYYDYIIGYVLYAVEYSQTRLCGLFNEPGYFATILAMVLCIEGFELKKLGNVIMLISGVATGSLSFFVISAIYIGLLYLRKNILKFVVICIVLAMSVIIIANTEFENPDMRRLSERLRVVDGVWVADNRSSTSIDKAFMEVIKKPKRAVWGMGTGYSGLEEVRGSEGVSTYKTYVIDYGLFGFFLMYVCLFIYLFHANKQSIRSIVFLITYIASIYQRPQIYTLPFFVLLISGTELIRYTEKQDKVNKKC